VSDETALEKYGEVAIPAIEAGGDKAVIRTADAIEPREAGLKQRVVVMEFASFDRALGTYDSAAYQGRLEGSGGWGGAGLPHCRRHC
jgi:uncharacterized protein (DUF1330 family)